MKDKTDGKRDWQNILACLTSTHTVSLRDLCCILKATPPWININITPYLNEDAIYLSGGFSCNGKQIEHGIDWREIASMQLHDDKFKRSSKWYNTHSFLDLFRSSIVSCTQQTKQIPIGLLMNDYESYLETDKHLANQIDALFREVSQARASAGNNWVSLYKEIKKLNKDREENTLKHLTKDGKVIYNNRPSYSQRYDGVSQRVKDSKHSYAPVKRIDVPIPDVDFLNPDTLIAVHDLCDYGDSVETVYRDLFTSGAIRVECEFKNSKDKPGKKIFYINDPISVVFSSADSYIYITREIYDEYHRLFAAYEQQGNLSCITRYPY